MNSEFEKQLKRGMLDILILKKLEKRYCYGYELLKYIKNSSDIFQSLKEGTLYPRLYHLLEKELIACSLEMNTEKTKLIKVYQITELGKEQLASLIYVWKQFVSEMDELIRRIENE